MKKSVIFLFLSLLHNSFLFSQVSVNNTGNPPDSSAMPDMSSTTRGMLVPRMTASGFPHTSAELVIPGKCGSSVSDIVVLFS